MDRRITIRAILVAFAICVSAGTCWSAFITFGAALLVSGDPTIGLLPSASDGYPNWREAGLNSVPLTGYISGTTLTTTYSPSNALGPGQTISCTGCANGTSITAINSSTTYTVSPSQTVASVGSPIAMKASGIPTRSTIYTTLTACNPTATSSTCDDTTAINTALAACPAGQVVLLNLGVWQINGNGIQFGSSGCTLRGSGTGSQLSTGLNRVNANNGAYAFTQGCTQYAGGASTAIWCKDATATQLVKMDRATNTNYEVISMHGALNEVSNFTGQTFASSTTLTVTGAVGGDGLICVDQQVLYPPVTSAYITALPGNVTFGCSSSPGNYTLSVAQTAAGPQAMNSAPTGYGEPGGQSYIFTSDAVLGANSITLTTTPSGLAVGDMVRIDEDTYNSGGDTNVVYGTRFGAITSGVFGYFSRPFRTISQIMEVSAIVGNTITFDSPFTYAFHTANAANMVRWNGTFQRGSGVENLFIWGGQGGDGHGNIAMMNCAYCWVKNVESVWSLGSSVGIYASFRSVLRDSFIHETPSPTPGGGGYLNTITDGASENLVENNIFWYGNKVNTMRGSGGGNVWAYNYASDSFDNGNSVVAPEAGINAGHFTTPHLELLEGNWSHNADGDALFGNSIYITFFRNTLSGLRTSSTPNTGTLPLYGFIGQATCGPGNYVYGDYIARWMVDIQGYSYYNNFVGNVLGYSGQTLLNASPANCYNGNQTAFNTQITTLSDWNTYDYNGSGGAGNYVNVWEIGNYYDANLATWTFVSTIGTITRSANYDFNSSSEISYSYGSASTTTNPTSVPNSFYLASKPAFFGAKTWPWVDPATGTTYTLPAKYCFEHNQMPTC